MLKIGDTITARLNYEVQGKVIKIMRLGPDQVYDGRYYVYIVELEDGTVEEIDTIPGPPAWEIEVTDGILHKSVQRN